MSQLETTSGSFLGRFLPKLGPCRKARPSLFAPPPDAPSVPDRFFAAGGDAGLGPTARAGRERERRGARADRTAAWRRAGALFPSRRHAGHAVRSKFPCGRPRGPTEHFDGGPRAVAPHRACFRRVRHSGRVARSRGPRLSRARHGRIRLRYGQPARDRRVARRRLLGRAAERSLGRARAAVLQARAGGHEPLAVRSSHARDHDSRRGRCATCVSGRLGDRARARSAPRAHPRNLDARPDLRCGFHGC